MSDQVFPREPAHRTATPEPPPIAVSAPGGPAATEPGRRRWLVLAVIAVAQLMVVLDATIVNIALPSAQRALGFSTTDRQWVVTAYALAFGGLLIVGGRLSDLFGRKRTFVTGLAGFAVASAAGGAAPDFAALVAARAVQGAFGALLAPSALALLTTTFTDPRERGKALGIYTAIAGGGGAIGLLLGGLLTEYLSWRWCLYVNIVFAAAALTGATRLISNQPRNPGATLDVPGSLLAAGGLAGIVYGFSQGAADGWGSAATVAPTAAGVALLGVFTVVERRVARPLVPLGIIADRTRGTAYLGALIAGIGLSGTFLLATYYLQDVLGFTPLRAGLAFLPFVAGIIASANFVSNVGLNRFGPKRVVPAGMILAVAAAGLLTRIGVHGGYGTWMAPALVILGLGVGAVVTSAFSLGPAGARPADAGVAAALVNSSNQVGFSLGAALLNTIASSAAASYLARHGSHVSPPSAVVHGDITAFWFLAALFAAGAILTALLFPGRRQPSRRQLRRARIRPRLRRPPMPRPAAPPGPAAWAPTAAR
jgi:EmrB/QacA subfamily drug resistance transporter